ncbi:MAG: hypothetical protein ABFD92_09375 [Planctomycetaceae bacterium]|nr:hypothetical protein [Planctomycetaceae bacterium]
MKSIKAYETKIKKIINENRPAKRPRKSDQADPVVTMIEGILQADATEAEATVAMALLNDEFVDYNELRVAPVKDIVECLRELPFSRRKACTLQDSLNAIFYRTNDVSGAHMEKMPAKAVRRYLMELGLDHYAAAYTAMVALDVRALPVDQTLVETMELNGHLPPGLDRAEIQKMFERLVGRSDMMTAHLALRQYVAKHAKALAKHRKIQEQAQAKIDAANQAVADAAAKVKAEADALAKAKAREEELTQARARAKAKALAKGKGPGKTAGKPAPAGKNPSTPAPRKAARK